MNELIKVGSRTIDGVVVQTVNARDLHRFLEVGKVFAAWIQERIEQYGFIGNQDYLVFSDSGKNLQGGRPTKEYAITIDMAKELSMVERNEKGKQARQYFLECERRVKNGFSITSKNPVSEALKLTPSAVRAARALGLDKNSAAISANQLVYKITRVNLLEEFGHTHLVAENQTTLFFTPTELGKQINVSGRGFNLLLAEAGLQMKKGESWTPTEEAEGFYRIYDTGKHHHSGTPIHQIKWAENVLSLVNKQQA